MLTDAQWRKIEPLFRQYPMIRRGGRRAIDNRSVVEGILWVLGPGAPSKDLPDRFPSPSTRWRRLREWEEQGVWDEIRRTFLSELEGRGRITWEEVFAEATFVTAKKRGTHIGPSRRGKGTKLVVVASRSRVPLGVHLDSASPAQVKLLEATLADVNVPKRGPRRPRSAPRRIVADRGYNCDALRERLKQRGVERIPPHRRGRKRGTQHGRKLRRCKRRWIVERTFAWLSNFRRLVVCQERHITMFKAFVHVACALLALRHF